MEVIAGKLRLSENHPDGQTGYVSQLITHPHFKYVSRTINQSTNDLALLELHDALIFTSAVKPIKLPNYGQKFVGDVLLTGWGHVKLRPKPVYATTLQVLRMPLISKKECKRLLDTYPVHPHVLSQSEICTLPYGLNQNACTGDSGGPLIQDRILVGITSWGEENCGQNLTRRAPNVFTEVSEYVTFIKKYTGKQTRSNDFCK
ncbi:hypothetical protein ILUMI_08033 [Ignelater luminosus]|uniref:Peptidase S1 domain-containing protein n=1 Tax=Ignelater luminosus TaxID=2038154 RepID=A0A8K0D2E5_IGNLU|nr:hypothetical protein ILUMI_08033 [Ignelater luminosus]